METKHVMKAGKKVTVTKQAVDETGRLKWKRDKDGGIINLGGTGRRVGTQDETWMCQDISTDKTYSQSGTARLQVKKGGNRLCISGLMTQDGWIDWRDNGFYDLDHEEYMQAWTVQDFPDASRVDRNKAHAHAAVKGIMYFTIKAGSETKDPHMNVDGKFIVSYLDFVSKQFDCPTLVVMDNSPTHRLKCDSDGNGFAKTLSEMTLDELKVWAQKHAPAVYKKGTAVGNEKLSFKTMTMTDDHFFFKSTLAS
jgi:hypothetical protein